MKIKLLGRGWIVSFLALGAATPACAFESGPGELDSVETPGSIENALVIPPQFIVSASWTAPNDIGVTKTLIADTQGFCALSGMGGRFRSSADFVGVWQSGGHFTLSGSSGSGNAIRGWVKCVPISKFQTNNWAFSGVFSTSFTSSQNFWTGTVALSGWPESNARCWINGFGGNFGPGGRLRVMHTGTPDPFLFLHTSVNNQSLLGRASCAGFWPGTFLHSRLVGNTWNQSQGTGTQNTNRKLANAYTHFCYLTDVAMTAPETTDQVYIAFNSNDGFYYLSGNWSGGSARLSAAANCIAYNQL